LSNNKNNRANKVNRAKAIRYSSVTAICHALDCQPGELLSVQTAK
jgi:putative transcriptional regulator